LNVADAVIRTDRCTPADILVRALSHLKILPQILTPCVDVIVGGQYGSEGKGNIVAHISREYDYLVRVGGPNAGHKVYEEPEPYTFHLLPSGTRHSNARLIIGPGAVLNVEILLREINDCKVSHSRLSIDPQAIVIEPDDIKFETKTLKDTISSTAQGVGYATARRIMRGSLGGVRLAQDVE